MSILLRTPWVRALLVLSVVLVPNPVRGQRLGDLAAGARVRVDVLSSRDSWFGLDAGQPISGALVRVQGDTIFLAPRPPVGAIAIPFAAVRRVYLSRGHESRIISALRGAVVPAIAGALSGALAPGHDAAGRPAGRGHAALIQAAPGAAVGALIGAFTPGERWELVTLPARAGDRR